MLVACKIPIGHKNCTGNRTGFLAYKDRKPTFIKHCVLFPLRRGRSVFVYYLDTIVVILEEYRQTCGQITELIITEAKANNLVRTNYNHPYGKFN